VGVAEDLEKGVVVRVGANRVRKMKGSRVLVVTRKGYRVSRGHERDRIWDQRSLRRLLKGISGRPSLGTHFMLGLRKKNRITNVEKKGK
jgi:hypothetical protein